MIVVLLASYADVLMPRRAIFPPEEDCVTSNKNVCAAGYRFIGFLSTYEVTARPYRNAISKCNL